jgi:hypothetical protein
MSTRKPRAAAAPEPPPQKLVPYPPPAIWKTKEEGAAFTFRGNTFMRRGDRVSYQAPPADSGSQGSS